MPTFLDSRQIKKRIALLKLGAAAGTTVESILDKVNIEFDAPLRMAASAIPDAVLNFSSSLLAAADGANKVVSPVKKQIFSGLTNPTINFQTQAVSNAADFDVTWGTATLGQFRYAAFTLIGSGKIKVLFSGEFGSEAALAAAVNPGSLFVSGGSPIGYVTLQATNASPAAYKTAGSATDIIENAKIYRPAASGGGSATGGSGAGGGELVDLLYQAAIRDSFTDIPDGTTTVDISAGFTDAALHDVANELFRLAYDASKTVSATGTAVTMSSAPTFTVKAGDIINIPGVDSPKKITAVTNQTTYTVESAWTVDPSSAACVVSQAVHTVDLNAFTNGGLGLAASSQFSGNIDDVLVAYGDSDTSGDIIPDFGTVADMGFSVSADGTAWSEAKIRPDSLSLLLTAASTPTASTQFKIRFFANKTSGSGFVNLLAYKAFFHKQTGETVGAQLLSAFARPTASQFQNVTHGVSGGKSRFQFTWAYPRGANDGEAAGSMLVVYANGQRIPRRVAGVTDDTQAYFVEISDTIIEMDTDYSSAGIDFQFRVERTVIDSNTQNTVRLSEAEDVLDQAVDAQVVASFLTAVNAAPTGSQFRSDITGRASIPDLSANLAISMGVNRLMTQNIAQLQDEFGPNGERVWKAVNDKFNQVRFVGGWTSAVDTRGSRIISSTSTADYVEVVFYGTGINLLVHPFTANDFRVSVDGGAEGANILAASYSDVLGQRNYATNTVVSAVSGLSLDLHTVKIRNNAANQTVIYGFEILDESSQLTVAPGAAVKGKYNNVLGVLSNAAYNSAFESGTLGTRGGNVVVYLKPDGTIGKAVTPTNNSQATLTSADHTNEEVIRVYNWREFGAGRTDDFSGSFVSVSNRAFTLDDGTTTLVGLSVSSGNTSNPETVSIGSNSGFITLTFVGTGLDIIQYDAGSGGSDSYNVQIDGGSTIALPSAGIASPRQVKIVSGLPYGTHTVKINRVSAATWTLSVQNFIVYGPKKPIIPSGAIELAQYYIMADYSIAASAAAGTMSTGTLRKQLAIREAVYTGTWGGGAVDLTSVTGGFETGFNINTTTSTSTMSYTFFGTGFDWRGTVNPGGASNATLSVDGSTDLSGFSTTFQQTGSGNTFTAATGVLAGTSSSGLNKLRVAVSGLALGLHTVRWTQNTSTQFNNDSLDVITPIHAPALNLSSVFQNTLAVGNSSITDARLFNSKDIKIANFKNISRAQGVAADPTTTVASSPGIPIPQMSVSHYSKTGRIRVMFDCLSANSSGAGTGVRLCLMIDGMLQSPSADWSHALGANRSFIGYQDVINVTPGFHKIDMNYSAAGGGTASMFGIARKLIVEDVD